MDAKTAQAHKPEPEYFEYTSRDAIIYALGIGCNVKHDVRYLYENDGDFSAFPSFIVAPGLTASSVISWPGVEADLARILHGEQYIELYKNLPTEGKLRSEARVVDILDKGSGALILSEVTTYDDATNEKLAMQQFSIFQLGSGNFGGSRTSPHEKPSAKIPTTAPDAVIEEKTSHNQAAFYRLGSGDLNPLHIDSMFAKMSGFDQPILHGLCSLGFSTRHVIQAWAGNDGSKFKKIKTRFSSAVIPGQTLRTEMWKDGNRIIFQTKVKETGKVVIANAYVELENPSDKPTVPEEFAAKL